MVTTSDVRPLEPPSGPPPSGGLGPVAVRRVVGVVLIAVVVAGFFSLTGFPRLDQVREEVAIAAAVDVARAGVPADQVTNCFQGFCFEDDVGFLERWWDFSTTYLRLIWGGLALAIVLAALVDAFLFPSGRGPAFGTWTTAGLESRADRRGSSLIPVGSFGIAGAGVAVGAVGAPALVLTVVLFSPHVWGPRLVLAATSALVMLVILRSDRAEAEDDTAGDSEPEGAATVLRGAALDSARAAWRFGYRLVPLFVLAAILGGIGAQVFTVDGVNAVVGDHLPGLLLAVVVGLLIDLPLTFGVPIGALALLVGADPVVVGVFLVSLSIVGPRSFVGLARSSGPLVAGTLAIVVLAGSILTFGVARTAIAATSGPTISWDGEECRYRGPARVGPGVHEFTVRNLADDRGDGQTLAVVVGRIPSNVSVDHFAATVAADPAAHLPEWFRVAGTQEFIFPGKSQRTQITLHHPGTYAMACLHGGGFYVIYEFSMPQPMGWFEEFRSTFDGFVAEQTLEVAG